MKYHKHKWVNLPDFKHQGIWYCCPECFALRKSGGIHAEDEIFLPGPHQKDELVPTPHYVVEYDLSYSEGNYSGVGEHVLIAAASEALLEEEFQKQTGVDWVHVISYRRAYSGNLDQY